MAQRTITANFKRMLTQNMNKIGYMAGLGNNVVLDLTMGGVEFIDGIRQGMQPILAAHELGPAANSNKVWTEVARRTARIIASRKNLGNIKLTQWSQDVSTPGMYLFKAENLRVKIRLIRQKRGTSFVTGDNRVAQIATAYRDLAYKMWLKVVDEEIKKSTGRQSTFFSIGTNPSATFSSKVQYQSATRGSTQKTIQSIIAQNTNVAHKKGTTKADLAMKGLKESNPSVSTALDISIFDIMDYAEKNLDVTFYKNEKKKKVGSYSFDTLVETRLAYNTGGSEESDKKATILKFENAIQGFIEDELSNPNGQWHKVLVGVDTIASKKPRKKVGDDVVEDIIRPMTKAKTAKRTTKPQPKFKNDKRSINVKKAQKTKAVTRLVQGVNVSGKVGRPQKQERENI